MSPELLFLGAELAGQADRIYLPRIDFQGKHDYHILLVHLDPLRFSKNRKMRYLQQDVR